MARRVLLALVLALLVAACSGPPDVGPPAAPVDVRSVDVAYARAMVPHHEQALELCALVRGRTASPDVADLAFRIDRDQVEEVGQLRGLLRAWGREPGGGQMDGMDGMDGMAPAATVERLRTSSGPAFDRLWVATMTAHHRGALAMARTHLATTGDASALREFSRTLLVSQQAEIDRMATLPS